MTYEEKKYWLEELKDEVTENLQYEIEFMEAVSDEGYEVNDDSIDRYKEMITMIDEVLEDLFILEDLQH